MGDFANACRRAQEARDRPNPYSSARSPDGTAAGRRRSICARPHEGHVRAHRAANQLVRRRQETRYRQIDQPAGAWRQGYPLSGDDRQDRGSGKG